MPRIYTRLTIEERLLRKVRSAPSGCLEWTGCVNNKGYGVFSLGNGRVCYAHRVSYAVNQGLDPTNKKILGELLVLHRCDNPRCVNPAHLFLGTHKMNTEDMDAKGRRVNAQVKGESHPACKLTDSQVTRIRAAYDKAPKYASGRTQYGVVKELAKRFGVTFTTISDIGRRRSRIS